MSAPIEAKVRAFVAEFLADEIADLIASADPFGIDHDCLNPAGHDFRGNCREIVCLHCARIAWQ